MQQRSVFPSLYITRNKVRTFQRNSLTKTFLNSVALGSSATGIVVTETELISCWWSADDADPLTADRKLLSFADEKLPMAAEDKPMSPDTPLLEIRESEHSITVRFCWVFAVVLISCGFLGTDVGRGFLGEVALLRTLKSSCTESPEGSRMVMIPFGFPSLLSTIATCTPHTGESSSICWLVVMVTFLSIWRASVGTTEEPARGFWRPRDFELTTLARWILCCRLILLLEELGLLLFWYISWDENWYISSDEGKDLRTPLSFSDVSSLAKLRLFSDLEISSPAVRMLVLHSSSSSAR